MSPSSSAETMNALLAPHLPQLLSRSFPAAARKVLTTSIRTEGERKALLVVSEFVMGAQQEVADALSELQWRQMQKLRELCEVRAAAAAMSHNARTHAQLSLSLRVPRSPSRFSR